MKKNIIFVISSKGIYYAKWIASDLMRLDQNIKPHYVLRTKIKKYMEETPELTPENTILHVRVAHPRSKWSMYLLYLQNDKKYRVINKVEVIQLTSNKTKCGITLANSEAIHPDSWYGYRGKKTWSRNFKEINGTGKNPKQQTIDLILDLFESDKHDRLIVKPETSMDQGAHVKILEKTTSREIITEELDTLGGTAVNLCVQEYVPYNAIHRVIVIDGKALPMTFQDRMTDERRARGDWKVSVCLNRKTMTFVSNPDRELLELAEITQKVIGGEVSFIDIFETDTGYTISEINTACSLKIHEKMAKLVNHPHWDISAAIASYLYKQMV